MPNDIQATAQDFARVLLELFEQPQLIRGCLVKSVADKDEYTTNNGWIQAICGEHNQQPVRYFGEPAGLVVDTTYIDVLYFPSTKGFMVYGPGGTSDAGGAKVAQVWESDFGAVALQSDASGNIGIGTASPDGALHVLAGSAGTVSAVGGADTAVFEDDDAAGVGITILSPDAINNQIVFGVESDNAMCRILTNYNAGAPYLTVYVDGSERLRVNANGEVGIGITGPDGTLHVHTGSAGSVSPVAGADDFIVESDDSSGVGMTILAPDARNAQIVFGVPSSNAMARVLSNYNSGSPYLALFTNGSERVRVDSVGNTGIGATPQGRIHSYGSISGFLVWEYDGLDATVRTIVPNGSGDCLYRLHAEYVLRDSAGAVASGSTDVSNSASVNLTVGSNTVRLRVNADGSIDTSRTAGSDTIKVAYTLRWL